MDIIHLEPNQYIHVKDQTKNIVALIEGPVTYIQKSNEVIVKPLTQMIKLKPNTYIQIQNPVIRDNDGNAVMEEKFAQAKLNFGEREFRTYEQFPQPFALYPGESTIDAVTESRILGTMDALKIFATRDFNDGSADRKAGDEWVVRGPLVYTDRVEADVVEVMKAQIIQPNSALRLRAKIDFTDSDGNKRISGEEYMIRKTGSYILCAEEELVSVKNAEILSDRKALALRALTAFTDIYGKNRRAGEEWLITNDISTSHIPDVNEERIGIKDKVVLNKWQYCTICNPLKEGRNLFGQKELRKGESSFFLNPGEHLENGIQNIELLGEDEALLLLAREVYNDEYGTHQPGERWMIQGPRNYIPDIEVEILERRKRIPLDNNEGIYVRDIHTGEVRMITGETYLLKAHEVFWEKILPEDVERLIQSDNGSYSRSKPPVIKDRKKHLVVTFTVPHNSCCQIFDYKKGVNRVVFGPELIKLSPYEQFTILDLSGGNPKKEDCIKSLVLRLGPDSISDHVEVETSDHARLKLKLTYSWQFEFDRADPQQIAKLFQVKDFVGDCCKSIASRIRGTVSMSSFDNFHKESSSIVQTGVFGINKETQQLKKPLRFHSNGLVITNVDIQSQEPIETKIRSILNKSMTLSMETSIKIQESESKHREDRANQEANGTIEMKKIAYQTESEDKKLELLKYDAANEEIKICGKSESQAKAISQQNEIESETILERTRLEFEAEKISKVIALEYKKKNYENELNQLKRMSELEIEKAQTTSESQINKVTNMVAAIGKDTLVHIAKAGPETQAKILGNLGVKSMLITDGKNPINLFNTANGLIGNMQLPK